VSDGVGWMATAVFAASYFVRARRQMLAIQIAAACLWVGYGLATKAGPVIAANLIVASSAALSLWRRNPEPG